MTDPLLAPSLDLPTDVKNLLRCTILRSEVGSTAHGTGLPGVEDHDQMAIYIQSPEKVIGMGRKEHLVWRTAAEGERSGPDDIDLTMYSARKYIGLAAAGNPSILVALFSPQVFSETTPGRMLRSQSYLFRSKRAGERFLGYMDAQVRRMEDSRAGIRAPRVNRPELIAEHGYDTKFAMHALRLGIQGIEFVHTGRITLPVPEPHRTLLLDVRHGQVPYEKFLEHAAEHRAWLASEIDNCDAPAEPNYETIKALIVDMHFDHWGIE